MSPDAKQSLLRKGNISSSGSGNKKGNGHIYYSREVTHLLYIASHLYIQTFYFYFYFSGFYPVNVLQFYGRLRATCWCNLILHLDAAIQQVVFPLRVS